MKPAPEGDNMTTKVFSDRDPAEEKDLWDVFEDMLRREEQIFMTEEEAMLADYIQHVNNKYPKLY
jgi:hypothetical protein